MNDESALPAALSDELIRRAIAEAPDGIIVTDAAGSIVFANPIAAQMFGYDTERLAGRSVDELLPTSARTAHEVHRTEYLRHPRPRPMGSGLDLHGRRRTGEEFPVEISLSPVQTDANTCVIAIVRDVTERREAAEELQRVNEELALVDDRERIARDLHDTVIQRLFAVGLSLQGALGAAPDPRLAERIETAIDEIDGTIRDIRTAIFSLHARRVATTGLRDDVIATSREAGRALGFEPQVVFDGPIDSATTSAVREQLVPTLREALSNIVKHAHATRVMVSVAIVGDDIVLAVTDNGAGIEARAHGGRGIGNMTDRARALGGCCEVRAVEPAGTIVEWRVPANA
jgi:two-component system, NarL family, sensor histidine kinase DevS